MEEKEKKYFKIPIKEYPMDPIPGKRDEFKTIVLPSYELPSQGEIDQVIRDTAIEREWLKDALVYVDIKSIKDAFLSGRLEKINPEHNYLPIMRFRNPELNDKYPPYLDTQAKEVLNMIGDLWRTKMTESGFDEGIRFSITSMVRSAEYQKSIVEAGKLASQDSAHTYGYAFDIDARAYYFGEDSISEVPLEQQRAYENEFKSFGIDTVESPIDKTRPYDQRVMTILAEVLDDLQDKGLIHYLHELPGTQSSAFHVCVKPTQVKAA